MSRFLLSFAVLTFLSCGSDEKETPFVDNNTNSNNTNSNNSNSNNTITLPPITERCEVLRMEFGGEDCETAVCSPAECDCNPFSTSVAACNPISGCLTAYDCQEACALQNIQELGQCAQTFETECTTDQECEGDFCVRGLCSPGMFGDACTNNPTCNEGQCVERICTYVPSDCVMDQECPSGRCVEWTDANSATISDCSDGELGDRCDLNTSCAVGDCRRPVTGVDEFFCYEGGAGDPCTNNTQCISETCQLSEGRLRCV